MTQSSAAVEAAAGNGTVEIGSLRPDECRAVAQLHCEFFGGEAGHGHSLALLGPDFLERVFYRTNIDNPYFFVDVARYGGAVVAFSVYSSDHRHVFRRTIRRRAGTIALALLRSLVTRPRRTLTTIAANLLFLSDSLPAETAEIRGWFLLLGVKQPCRSREFRERTGVWIAGEFKHRLEAVLRSNGCRDYWAAPAANNEAANSFYHKIGAQLFATGVVQGTVCNYYRMSTQPTRAGQAHA
jgi:hypothetical protein